MKSFPTYLQSESKDCGPTCLKIIAKHYGKTINIQELRDLSETNREGSNLLNISDAAEKIGFRSLGVKLDLNNLHEAPLPCILHWNKEHYVVLYSLPNPSKGGAFSKFIKNDSKYYISDPAIGLITYTKEEFLKFWIGNNANENSEEGIALLLEPTPKFFQQDAPLSFGEGSGVRSFGFSLLINYITPYKSFLIRLVIGLLAASLLDLIFPFLTQSIVDVGIQNQNINFIYLILFAQLFLFLGKTALELIRSWILLHLST